MEGPSGFGGRMPRGEGLAKKKEKKEILIQKPYAAAYDFQKKTLYFLDVKNRIVDG